MILTLLLVTVFSCTAVDIKQLSADEEWIKQTLIGQLSKTRHHVTNPDNKELARAFLFNQLKEYGLEVYDNSFNNDIFNNTGRNVIGLLKGDNFKTPQDRIIILMAHYDTVWNTSGVDDNGSGVVTVLKAAKTVMKSPKREHSIIVAFTDYEEAIACQSEFCGATSLADAWILSVWTQSPTVQAVITVDTVLNFDDGNRTQFVADGLDVHQVFPEAGARIDSRGWKGDFLAVIGRRFDQNVSKLFRDEWSKKGNREFESENFALPMGSSASSKEELRPFYDFTRSDHFVFWRRGHPAVFLTDTGEFRGYMRNCYHGPCDNLDHVTDLRVKFVAKVADTIVSTVNIMSPPLSPANHSGSSSYCVNYAMVLTTVWVLVTFMIGNW